MADASILPELKARHAAHVLELNRRAKERTKCECGLTVCTTRLPLHRFAKRHFDALLKIPYTPAAENLVTETR